VFLLEAAAFFPRDPVESFHRESRGRFELAFGTPYVWLARFSVQWAVVRFFYVALRQILCGFLFSPLARPSRTQSPPDRTVLAGILILRISLFHFRRVFLDF